MSSSSWHTPCNLGLNTQLKTQTSTQKYNISDMNNVHQHTNLQVHLDKPLYRVAVLSTRYTDLTLTNALMNNLTAGMGTALLGLSYTILKSNVIYKSVFHKYSKYVFIAS